MKTYGLQEGYDMETITVHSFILPALIDEEIAPEDERYIDALTSFIENQLIGHGIGWHYGEISEPYFGEPTLLPTTPSFNATEYNFKGTVVDVDIVPRSVE